MKFCHVANIYVFNHLKITALKICIERTRLINEMITKLIIYCLQSVGVSAVTGEGVEEFFQRVDEAAVEYEK